MLKTEQLTYFPEVVSHFSSGIVSNRDVPNIVQQLNLFLDVNGLIRVGGKIIKSQTKYFPVLLHKSGVLTSLIILRAHVKLCHSRIYHVLDEIRKQFWIPSCFSATKEVFRTCVHCRQFNNRTIKLNQNDYRDFHLDPSEVPFSIVFLNHFGPFMVTQNGKQTKTFILCITCLFTRSINLKISEYMTSEEFLHAFQLHSFEFGTPSLVLSDLGSQIVAAADTIRIYLHEPVTESYFRKK